MAKKKDLLKIVKEQLKNRREDIICELDKLYKDRAEALERQDCLDDINQAIDEKISEIAVIDNDLSRKDKKSSNVEWLDPNYKASARGNGSRTAEITNEKEYSKLIDKQWNVDSGPQSLWLKSGILVKARGRTLPGIVVDIRSTYATVLFGGSEVNMRKLALRPAEWED